MVITRFAPSPTGMLHIGGARTALFCWLWAQKHQGKFLLRIEDTDKARSTPEAVTHITEALRWLGLHWEGALLFQSQRLDRYQEVAEQLLKKDLVYKCYCSPERLEALRMHQMETKQKPRYDRHCLHSPPSHTHAPFVLRFRTPHTGTVSFDDLIKGPMVFQNSELDDLILMRSDGTPTYHFSVVVDDWDMKITHVLRGDDHLNNTPRQIPILRALGAKIPVYGHLPMLLDKDGKKLSKRTGALGVLSYREEGILPEALLNYLVRLGWSHGDQEIFTREEMVTFFDIHHIQPSAARVDPDKLLWLNQHYIKTLPLSRLTELLALALQRAQIAYEQGPPLEAVVVALRDRCKTIQEMVEKSRFCYERMPLASPKLQDQYWTEQTKSWMPQVITTLEALVTWQAPEIQETIQTASRSLGLSMGQLAQPLRVALTGTTVSPPIHMTLALLGKQEALQRLREAQQRGS